MKKSIFIALCVIAALVTAQAALADIFPGVDVSIGIEGAGADTAYTVVDDYMIVNEVSVFGPDRASFGHFQTSGYMPALPGSPGDYTWALDLDYVAGSFDSLTRTAMYDGIWYMYSPDMGVDLPDYYEKAEMNIMMSYNPQFSSAALSGEWFMEKGPGTAGALDYAGANPYMLVNGTWDASSNIGTPNTNEYYGQPRVNMHVHGQVPEPASMLLGALGLSSVAGYLKLRKK